VPASAQHLGCDVGAVGSVAPVLGAGSVPAILPLGGSVAEEKNAGAARLGARRAANARQGPFVSEVQRGIFRLDTPRREE